MIGNENTNPICSECGNEMVKGKIAVRLNRFCIQQIEGWYCPKVQ